MLSHGFVERNAGGEWKKEREATSDSHRASIDGQLLLDTTCVWQDMLHQSYVLLLKECSEKTVHIIDVLHYTAPGTDKLRTYRKVARKEFMIFMHSKKRIQRMVRRALRKQIAYV